MDDYAVYDIESNDWAYFEMLGFFDGYEFRIFESTKRDPIERRKDAIVKFLKHLDKRRYRSWNIYAHNGGRFDFLFLAEDLIRRSEARLIERGGRIIAAHVKGREATYTLCDSYALLPQSLKKLGVAFGTEHQKLDFDVKKGVSRTDPKARAYLENDCKCLHEVLAAFFKSPYVVKPQLTIASQAMDTWRRQYLGAHKIQRVHLDHEKIFRDNFYSGGRVEVFKGTGKNIHVFDVNSLFPHAMTNEMPVGDCEEVKRYYKGDIGFYNVTIKHTPKWYVSPLLEKRKKGNYYCTGAGEYYLSSATLDYLKSVWAVNFTVNWGLRFRDRADLFSPYVNHFYKIKKEKKGGGEYLISKFMLNSLYGKMGMSAWRESLRTLTPDLVLKGGYSMFDAEMGLVLVMEKSRNQFILPYLAGYITDLARLYHYRLLSLSSDALFYCDTDSLHVQDYKTYRPFIGTELGQLDYLGKHEGVYIAPKTYALRDESSESVHFKGFGVDSFSFADMRNALVKKTPLKEKRERLLSLRECINLADVKHSKRKVIADGGRYLKVVESEKKAVAKYDRRLTFKHPLFIFNTRPFDYAELPSAD